MATAVTTAKWERELGRLREELTVLRNAVDTSVVVTVTPDRQHAYLGQSIGLKIAVHRSVNQHPVAGARLTLVADRGELRGRKGLNVRKGRSVHLVTDGFGHAYAELLPTGQEPLTERQRAALNHELAVLDPNIERPEQALGALDQLVERYRWRANSAFREAVDILFSNKPAAIEEPINSRGSNIGWFKSDTSILIHAAGSDHGPIQGSGLAIISFADWLTPWFARYKRMGSLRQRLDVKLQGMDPAQFADSDWLRILERGTHSFLNEEQGRIGQRAARLAANEIIRNFTRNRLAELTEDRRVRLHRHLDYALDAQGVALNRLSFAADVESTGGQALNNLGNRIAKIDTALAGKASIAQVKAMRTQINTNFQNLQVSLDKKASVTALENIRSDLDGKAPLDKFNALSTSLLNALNDTNAQLDKKADTAALNLLRGLVNGKASSEKLQSVRVEFRNAMRETNQALAKKADLQTVQLFREELDDKVSIEHFENFENEIREGLVVTDRRIAGKADRFRLDRLLQETDREKNTVRELLAGKANNTEVTTLRGQLQQGLNKKLNTGTFTRFKKDNKDDLKARVTVKAFAALRKTVNRNLESLSDNVRNFVVLDTNILRPTGDTVLTPIDLDTIIIRPGNG